MTKVILLFPILLLIFALGYDFLKKPHVDKKRLRIVGLGMAILILLGIINIFLNGEYVQQGQIGNPLPQRHDIVCQVETYCDGFSFSNRCLGAWRNICAPQTLKTDVQSSVSE